MKLDKLVQLDEICNNYQNVYIWGAGSFGENVLAYLSNNGYEIKHFIDNDERKHKTKFKGIEVIGLKDYLMSKKRK